MRRFMIWLVMGWLLVSLTFGQEDEDRSILILNSYSASYNWTNSIMDGILDHLPNTDEIHVEYMDTKNYASEAYFDLYYNFLHYKYHDKKFDIIITTDDYAFQFALKYRNDLFQETPIFFTGVNSIKDYDMDELNLVYGLEEKVSAADTLQVIQELKPALKRLHLVIDDTISGQLTKKEIYDQIGDKTQIIDYAPYSLEEISQKLSQIDSRDEAILLAFYIVDKDGEFINTDIMTQRVSTSAKIPIFGLYHFSFNHGIIGGKLVSGYEQGRRITQMIEAYQNGQYGNRHFESNEANLHYYDYEYLDRFNMDLKNLPIDAIIINKPESFFHRHKNIIYVSMIIIVLLLVYIIALREQVKRQTKRQILLNQQLVEADKLASLGDMMKRISHELNTPIGNCITTATYIRKSISEVNSFYNEDKLSKSVLEKHIEGVSSTSEVLEHSLANVNELLNAFRIFSNHNESDQVKFDMKHYLENLLKTYQPIIRENHHQITLDIREQLILKGCTRDYYKIFNHLIKNALEHGFENLTSKRIHIHVYQESQQLKIIFTDNGHGIPSKHIDHIFEPLYRLDHNDHVVMGLGTVYKIVTQLKGHILCSSELGQGTSFQISIPLKKEL